MGTLSGKLLQNIGFWKLLRNIGMFLTWGRIRQCRRYRLVDNLESVEATSEGPQRLSEWSEKKTPKFWNILGTSLNYKGRPVQHIGILN